MNSSVIPSVLSYPTMQLPLQPAHHRHVLSNPLVLRYDSLFYSKTPDRNRTVSRRSKPNSRIFLIGEQPNPWNPLQLQDKMSRHRGAKRSRRYGLLRTISLLSPAYLLSVERQPFHTASSGHYGRLTSLLDLSILQLGRHHHYAA